jgi:transposase
MSNVLSEEKKHQVIALGRLGWTLRRIEHAVGVRRETAAGYLKAAGIAIAGPGRRSASKPAIPVATDSDSKPAIEVVGVATDFIRPFSEKQPLELPKPNLSASVCEPFREIIEEGLGRGRNAVAIWQDLVTGYSFSGAYNTVKRFVGKLRGSQQPKPAGIILTAPGEEAQVDYGTGPMVRDPQSGKYRRTRLFVMTLGYSRKAVRLLVFRSSTRTWAELHETAFRRLGGSCRVLVLDNLKEGVLTPDIHDPTLNPLFKDVLAHYGVVALPCRIQNPDRKGKVEAGVAHAQKTPLKGQRFETLEEAQTYLDEWESRWARHPHSRHDQTAGCRHVCRGEACAAAAAA